MNHETAIGTYNGVKLGRVGAANVAKGIDHKGNCAAGFARLDKIEAIIKENANQSPSLIDEIDNFLQSNAKNPESAIEPKTQVMARLRIFEKDFDVSKDEATQRFFGHSSLWLANHPESNDANLSHEDRKKTQSRRERARRKTNDHFYSRLKDEFGLESIADAKEFHEDQRKNANDTRDDVHNLLYPGNGEIVQLNASRFHLSPSRATELYTDPNTDPRLKFEVQTQYALELVTGQLDHEERKSNLSEKLALVQQFLDEELYEGQVGEIHSVEIKTVIDKRTNEVVGVIGVDGYKQPRRGIQRLHQHVIKETEKLRKVKGNGMVLTNPNEKKMPSSVAKVLKYAHKRRDEGGDDDIRVLVDRIDTDRLSLVAHGGNTIVDHVLERVDTIIRKNQDRLYDRDENGDLIYDKFGDPKGTILPVPDHKTAPTDKSQSKYATFKRLQIMLAGEENPLELKFETYQDYVRNQIHFGEFDPIENQFTGAAHDIYLQNRAEKGLDRSLHPQEIYVGIKLAEERMKAKKGVVKGLKKPFI